MPRELIREALTHADGKTTLRYIRRSSQKLEQVADAINAKRAAQKGRGK